MSEEKELYQLALKIQAEENQRGLISVAKRILIANPSHLPTWQLLHEELGNRQNLYSFIEVWGQRNLPQADANLFPKPKMPRPNTSSVQQDRSVSPSKPNSPQAEAILKTNRFSSVNVTNQTLPSPPQDEIQKTPVLKSDPTDSIPQPVTEPHHASSVEDTQEIRVRKTARTSAPVIPSEPEPDWLDMIEGVSSPKNDAFPTVHLQESPSPALQQPEWLELIEDISSPENHSRPAQAPPVSYPQTTQQQRSPSADLDPQCLSLLAQAAQARAASNEEVFERVLIRLIDRGNEILPGLARYRSRQPVNSPAWGTAEEILCRMLKVPTREMIQQGRKLPRTAKIMAVVGFILGIFIAIFAMDGSPYALFFPFFLSFILWMFTWFYGRPLSRDGGGSHVLIILLPFVMIYRASEHHSILREWKEGRQSYEKYLKDLIKQSSAPAMNGRAAAPAGAPVRNAAPQAAPMPAASPAPYSSIPPALDIRVARHGPFSYAVRGSSRFTLALKTERMASMVKYNRKEKGNIDAEIFPPYVEPKIIRKQFPPSEQAWYIFEKLPKTNKKETLVKIWRGMHTEVGVIIFVGNFLGGNSFWLKAPWMGLDAGFVLKIIGGSTVGMFITKTEAPEPLVFLHFSRNSCDIQIQRNPKFEEMPPDLEELLLMICFYIAPELNNPT